MEYKKRQKELRERLKNSAKNIWVSREINSIKDPNNDKETIKINRLVKGTYNKSIHGEIGSKLNK